MVICRKELLYALVICLGPFNHGNIAIYPSPTAGEIRAIHHLKENALEWSFYNGVVSLTAIVGPFLTEFLLRLYKNSRKKTIFTLAVASSIFWLFNLITKVSIWAGIAARALLGFTLGGFSALSPVFLVEIAPKGESGFYGTMNMFSLVLATCIINFLGPHLNYLQLSIYASCIPLIQSILIWFIPDTKKNDDDDGNLEKQETNKINLCQKKYAKGLLIGLLMMFFQQMCGVNAIITNLVDLMKSSGLNFDPCYQAGIAQLSQLFAIFIGGTLVDKLGRKIVWMISTMIVTIFLLLFALNTKFEWSNILPLVSIFVYKFGFGLGLGPIPWYIVPEYFDYNVRALANEIVSAVNWAFAFIIIFTWPLMKESLGMFGSFLLFMVITFISFLFGLFVVTEPKQIMNTKDTLSESLIADNF